ncbi:MAG TPA: hypothetical protein PK218_06915 [Flavobacterium sp.]|jgi:uncharacterized membrane protein|uniref:hypothetical protein n=1 Tax=Flavobacterium sp. TaxID=239 RepID=UPI002CAEFB14|nr:hypothetical protein [Flavobacterium sp.]MCA0347746.1 hypothetical protein [Bacteroidota bacterium]HPW98271.1 hypothetical protein [Flavobacterium sp.]HQA74532.1 hypothetical protein [Flavobacterium sp.]
MTDAHLHLVVNHFPIIGLFFAIGIMVFGVFLKSNILKNTAYVMLIITAIFGFLSMYTGEGAEEMVEDMPNIGHKIIHEHEELAEKFVLFLYAAGLLSILGLYFNLKMHSKANIVAYATLVVAIIAGIFAVQVGTSGGEVRHTEIRTEKVAQNNDIEKNYSDEHTDHDNN